MRCQQCDQTSLVHVTDTHRDDRAAHTVEYDCPACGFHNLIEHVNVKPSVEQHNVAARANRPPESPAT